jgi:hypothetical protein
LKKNNIKLKNTLNLNKSNIFDKYINNKYKLVPLKSPNIFEPGKYFPSESKEWTNNIYYFNSNYIKNLPVYDLSINKLLRNYFELYLNFKNIKSKILLAKKKYASFNKIFVSKAELKHTSSKVIITIYVFNRERIVLKKKLKKLKIPLKKIRKIFFIYNGILSKKLKKKLYKNLIFIKRTKLKFNINNLKFKDILLYKLSKLLSRFYKKKVEFNIVNLKSFEYNANILTDILRRKMRNRYAHIFKISKFILKKIDELNKINKINEINERINKKIKITNVNSNNLENKYKNININTIVKNINLNETIQNLYNTKNHNNEEFIFNSIELKKLGGIRLELKGRLTRRYRADRSLYKLKLKGNFRNISNSSVVYRGNTNSNLEYSMNISKRRTGAFAVKGWISGK